MINIETIELTKKVSVSYDYDMKGNTHTTWTADFKDMGIIKSSITSQCMYCDKVFKDDENSELVVEYSPRGEFEKNTKKVKLSIFNVCNDCCKLNDQGFCEEYMDLLDEIVQKNYDIDIVINVRKKE